MIAKNKKVAIVDWVSNRLQYTLNLLSNTLTYNNRISIMVTVHNRYSMIILPYSSSRSIAMTMGPFFLEQGDQKRYVNYLRIAARNQLKHSTDKFQ